MIFLNLVFQMAPKRKHHKCRYCSKYACIKKGLRNQKQRYQCKKCKKYQLATYQYRLYDARQDKTILALNAEGVGISSMSRLIGVSKQTIIRQIRQIAKRIEKPLILEQNQCYEVDEICTFAKRNTPANYVWIIYAINKTTKRVIDFQVGGRTKINLKIIIDKLVLLKPKKITTDGLCSYKNLINKNIHNFRRYSNNRIERCNLTLRNDLKRLSRKTIAYSKSEEMLNNCLMLYFYWNNWLFNRFSLRKY